MTQSFYLSVGTILFAFSWGFLFGTNMVDDDKRRQHYTGIAWRGIGITSLFIILYSTLAHQHEWTDPIINSIEQALTTALLLCGLATVVVSLFLSVAHTLVNFMLKNV